MTAEQKGLDDLRNLTRQMCDAIKESSTKFDLKSKLSNVERSFKDIQKKTGEYHYLVIGLILLENYLYQCDIYIIICLTMYSDERAPI